MNFTKNISLMMILSLGIMLTVSGCYNDSKTSDLVDPRTTEGIEYFGQQGVKVDIIQDDPDPVPVKALASDKQKGIFDWWWNPDLYYWARVIPPTVSGSVVQANAVLLSSNGRTIYIAYNTGGAIFRGAIQIITIDLDSFWWTMKVVKEYQFANMDINSLCLSTDGNTLLFGAVQSSDDLYPDGSGTGAQTFVGHINLTSPESIDIVKANMTPLNLNPALAAISPQGSFSVTGITATTDNFYYISVGAVPGGILKVSKTPLANGKYDLEAAAFTPNDDVRGVTGYNTYIYALQGTDRTPATANVLYNLGSSWSSPYPLTSLASPESKETIDICKDSTGGLAYLALSKSGLQIHKITTSGTLSLYKTYGNPVVSGYVTDTNSASGDSEYICTANGEYGIRILMNHEETYKITKPNFVVVGYSSMQGSTYGGLKYSANDVAYRSEMLVVAAGTGGVCVYWLDK